MTEALVGGAFLSASNRVLFDRMESEDLNNSKLDESWQRTYNKSKQAQILKVNIDAFLLVIASQLVLLSASFQSLDWQNNIEDHLTLFIDFLGFLNCKRSIKITTSSSFHAGLFERKEQHQHIQQQRGREEGPFKHILHAEPKLKCLCEAYMGKILFLILLEVFSCS
ncbi:hypothetical protein SCA6_000594 [Theobroma cacao]